MLAYLMMTTMSSMTLEVGALRRCSVQMLGVALTMMQMLGVALTSAQMLGVALTL